ncbi:Ribokinase-like protein [Syncephalastrum racemosum]|uniref:Ribokinase-like protein n=1 Tax=Syncephalastrum racemosum TaxID=13706 RepID=A0A1X2HE43_SYNRA|nr:Ribokinase-like protein [Syncephalastrum racemosum]
MTILVIGGVALDITATVARSTPTLSALLHTSNPGRMTQTLGGVGRNVCEAAMRAGARASLLSVVGDDLAGKSIQQGMQELGMSTAFIHEMPGKTSAIYNAIHASDGQLLAAVADMDIFDCLTSDQIVAALKVRPSLSCFDGNLSTQAMTDIASTAKEHGIPLFFEPTSIPKSRKVFDHAESVLSGVIRFVSPNDYELKAMSQAALEQLPSRRTPILQRSPSFEKAPAGVQALLSHAVRLSNYFPHVITKLGREGCLYVGQTQGICHVDYLAAEPVDPTAIHSVTGAGDTFVGAVLAHLDKHGGEPEPADAKAWRAILKQGQRAAVLTLQSSLAVSPRIQPSL